jgi:hypothetical protein
VFDFATDGQSASSSLCRAPLSFPLQDFNFLIFHNYFLSSSCRVPSLTRERVVICSAITQWPESRRTHNHTLLFHFILPQPEVRVTLRLTVSQSVCMSWCCCWVDVVTDGQSAYPSWCRAPLWGPWPDFSISFPCRTVAFLRLLRLAGITVEVFLPTSTRKVSWCLARFPHLYPLSSNWNKHGSSTLNICSFVHQCNTFTS